MLCRRGPRLLLALLLCLTALSATGTPAGLAAPSAAPSSTLSGCTGATPSTTTPDAAGAIGLTPDRTSRAFFAAMLTRMHLPATDQSLDALYSIEHFEGDNDRFNPLNVVQPEPGSTSINSVGVQAYVSFESGLQAAVTLLSNSHWVGVRAALANGTSTTLVLGAFQAAYTWVSAAFPVSDAISRGEAIRDVGGPYSDKTMAEQRAAAFLAPLSARFSYSTCAITAARSRADEARAEWSRLATDYAGQRAAYTTNLSQGTADQRAVDDARKPIIRAIVSDYRNGPEHSTVQALLSKDPNEMLKRADLMTYVRAHNHAVFARFAAQASAAKAELAAAASARTAAARTLVLMTQQQTAWVRADHDATAFRAACTAYLRTQLASSLTHAQAVSDLRELAAT